MEEFLTLMFWDNTVKQWLLAAGFIAGGAIAGITCSRFLTWLIKNVCYKTKFELDEIIVKEMGRPLAVLVTLGGIEMGLAFLVLSPAVRPWADRGTRILFIVFITWGVSKVFDALVAHYIPAGQNGIAGIKEAELQPVLRKLFKGLAAICAGGLILKTLGYNITTLMAGLGLGAAAIALASKDTLSNFFGSITVFVDRPFHLNDRIKITGFDGYITNMGIRTSRLRTVENHTVIIPNSVFASNPIVNISAEPNTRVSQTITIKRDNGLEKIALGLSLLREAGDAAEGVNGPSTAGLTAIGGLTCQITFVYYVAKNADYLDTVNRVNFEVLRRFEEAGITLA
ncbi:MAG: mechanosensitive ion channel family protein [Treponema sp.]|jgi:MscS family membrane protein|nr:mechanosensitive ion channel family protein [Treponema sp.]